MKDVEFFNLHYSEVNIPSNSLVYCDIPYKDTTKYSTDSFDHSSFYSWCKDMKDKGHDVVVSEYLCNVPEGWEVIWKHESKKGMRNKEGERENEIGESTQKRWYKEIAGYGMIPTKKNGKIYWNSPYSPPRDWININALPQAHSERNQFYYSCLPCHVFFFNNPLFSAI